MNQFTIQGQAQNIGQMGQLAQLDLRTANAGQLQDAARRRHGELAEKAKKLEHELRALTEEMVELSTMFPKQEAGDE